MNHSPLFIHGLSQLNTIRGMWPGGCALTIGSFDGVHRGHQVLLRNLASKAATLGLPSIVMVFEPQPYEFFSRERAPARLTRLREKVQKLFAQKVDAVVCLKFNAPLRELTAKDYIESILHKGLNVKYLVVGDDFRFGCGRSGDFLLLKQEGQKLGFEVSDTFTQLEKGERISSTRIRALLEQNRFSDASLLLGGDYSVEGRVIYGKQIGRQIGFRTANIGLGRYRSPIHGVFAVTITVDGVEYNAVANVGVKPTISGGRKPLLEVHILSFDSEIYGQWAKVRFLQKIRDEKQFVSLEELKRQIFDDIQQAKSFFASYVKT